ncbi:MAG TPA: DUF1854 domain-containing protein [Lachnospiraceae bacterium]|jgi:hypothetical protein|nr:DUF1854 domain-containing protein [Lachnospiraceae bacterium]HBY72028.1 DUF1854 domain-containing protein [Lachnospiraceae bacterium]HCA70328.1 DUF1854 domain-containing protein [Lachnospiraceae bacterium]HCM12418.1 DUF1854 domain-containing protein [Lachnospiraceae bacterium]HCR41000.1 DUF1854 domain-containing protein [Lachnospiraceae bacterium]
MSGKVKKTLAGTEKDHADPEEFDLEKMEKETEEMLRLRFITKENAVFERTEGGFVSMEIEGEIYPRVQVYRSFPFTDPDAYISIREPDEKAKEIGVIKNLRKDVSKETRQMLEEQLRLRYFTPKIEKIINIKDEYGFAYFDVLTDHGACRFTIHMGGGSVVNLSDTRLMITDLDGNRFEIVDVTKLSAPELKKLDLFL